MISLEKEHIAALAAPEPQALYFGQLLIESGMYEAKEQPGYEEAVYTHWSLHLYSEYGDRWREEGGKILSDLRKKVMHAVH